MSETDDKNKKPEEEPKEPETGDEGKLQAELEHWKDMARKQEARAKENAAAAKKLKELDEATKSETEKAAEKAANAEKERDDAKAELLRVTVAIEKGLTPAQARRISGATREELEADADAFLEETKPADEKGKGPSTKPKETLKGGTDPTEDPEEMDPKKLADMVPRY